VVTVRHCLAHDWRPSDSSRPHCRELPSSRQVVLQLPVSLPSFVPAMSPHIPAQARIPYRDLPDPREPGHESTSCPQPRSTDGKQCYACGGVGHVKSDCPSVRGQFGGGFAGGPGAGGFAGGQKCYQCGRPGHLARNCQGGAVGGGFRGGFARGPFAPRPRAPVNPDGTPVKC